MRAVGIDPGLSGALALLVNGEFVQVEDMPIAGRRVMPAMLAQILSVWNPDVVVIEDLKAMPRGGTVVSFSLGYSMGVAVAAVSGLSLPLIRIKAVEWKKIQGLIGTDKDASRGLAIERWPQMAAQLARKKDDGRAEAALIADAYLKKGSPHADPTDLGIDTARVRQDRNDQRKDDGPDASGSDEDE